MTIKKKKTTSFKSINKSDNDITQIDSQTYYHKSSDPDKEPYMVFRSNGKGFLCDCMSFVMSMTDTNSNPECKHIVRIKKQFNL